MRWCAGRVFVAWVRAMEVAALAVDLALVALQLAAPGLDTRSMARLDARRGMNEQRTISETDGEFHEAHTKAW